MGSEEITANSGSKKARKKSVIKINFVYSLMYQILTLILPLITAPYVSRVLGANLLGAYQTTHALANYFYLFTLLGVNNYGNREIARIREDRTERSRTFWEIYSFQLMTSVVVCSLYVLFCLFFESEYRTIYILQGLYVFSGALEVNWYCYGMEKFKLTTIRSMLIRIATLIAVFVFVRDRSDLAVYTAILSTGLVLSAIVVWPYVLKSVDFIKPTWKGIARHIKPNLILFWPVIAVSLYNIMDKLLLGHFSTNEEVAFYANAERIATIPVTMILALDNVVMPRMSNIFAKQETEKARELMSYVMLFAMFMSCAMAFGLAGVADVFAPWFYGSEFTRCGFYLFLLSFTIIFKGWAGALRTQYIIPKGKNQVFIISLTAGAVVNLILDFLLIPSMDGIGAIIGTIAAEASVAIIQFVMCRKEVPMREYLKNGISFTAIGLVMFFCVRAVTLIGLGALPTLLIQIVFGAIIYVGLAFVYMILTKQPYLINEGLKTLRIKYRFK